MSSKGAGPSLAISDKAAELHHAMITTKPEGFLFQQNEMQDLIRAKSLNELFKYTQELINNVSRKKKHSII